MLVLSFKKSSSKFSFCHNLSLHLEFKEISQFFINLGIAAECLLPIISEFVQNKYT